MPKNLLYPRTKGFIATAQKLRKAPQVKAVYDLTIAYQQHDKFRQAPSMWDSLTLPNLTDTHGYKFHIHAKRFPIETLPETDDELAKWLELRWIEKGEWLEAKREEWSSTPTQ